MANLKDLLVNGVARVIGKVYSPEFVGKLTGNADTATTATKLGTSNLGGTTQPIYLNAGVPTAGTTLGDSAYKGVDTTPTSGSSNVITSGGVYTELAKKANTFSVSSSNDTASWNSAVTVGTVAGTILKFTMPSNPNSWRGIADNLTTDNGEVSLSARQGKVLNEKIANFDYRGRANTWSAVNTFSNGSDVTSASSTASGAIIASNGGIWAAGGIRGNKVYNAVWNDLADCIPVDEECELTPGYCYCFDGEKYYKSSKYLDDGIIGIHSDTYGMHMGYKDNCKQMDVAVAGFVLAYVDKEYPAGTPLTCTENGYLTKIEKSDKMEYPEKIVATYWKNESSEYWGGEKDRIKVNGRKWVKVK